MGSSLDVVGRERCCCESVADHDAAVKELQMRASGDEERILKVAPVNALRRPEGFKSNDRFVKRPSDLGASRLREWDPRPEQLQTAQVYGSASDAGSHGRSSSSRAVPQPGTRQAGAPAGVVVVPNSVESASTASGQSSGSREDAPGRLLSKFDRLQGIDDDSKLTKDRGAPQSLDDGVSYVGEWSGKLRHGYGKMSWPDGACYQGQWQEDKAEGQGRFLTREGDCYCGEWSNGVQHGSGTFFWASGLSYFGQWEWSQCHGLGVEVAMNSEGVPDFKYAGYFRRGRKHGRGVCTWSDGGEYAGDWHKGSITGQGLHKDYRDRFFQGQWLSSGKHGSGAFLWPDGRCYGGQYSGDEAAGYGFYIWPNGLKDVGFWVDQTFYNIKTYSMDEIRSRIANHRAKLAQGEPESDRHSDRLGHLLDFGSYKATEGMPNVTQEFRRNYVQDYVIRKSQTLQMESDKAGRSVGLQSWTTLNAAGDEKSSRRPSAVYQMITEAHLFSGDGIFSSNPT